MKRAVVGVSITFAVSTALLAGCTGMLGDPEEQVATLELRADSLGALKATACVATFGDKGCSPYPNPLECEAMSIAIQRDGRTCATCIARGRVQREVCGSILEGIPIVCHATQDLSCRQCVDVYGNTVHDSCNRSAELFRSNTSGWQQLPDGTGKLVEPDDGTNPGTDTSPPDDDTTPPTTPPSGGAGKCDASQARTKYAEALNQILASEGLKMTYSPVLGTKLDLGGFWSFFGYGGFKGDLCKQWLNNNSYMTQCWSNEAGKCHCRCNPGATKQTCRCSRITIAALRAACSQIPAECDYKTWAGAYAIEYGAANAWINTSSYMGGFFGNIPTPPSASPPGTQGNPPSTVIPPTCLGSPLVFDLDDDGVEPTAPGAVAFDLLGQGRVRTAWVQGDDALLVLDRNGNGLIDDGAELFGEATELDGLPAPDGFHALAALDRSTAGGNGNGVLEPDDLMFGELRLWSDRNGDGVSQPEELRDLPGAGIRSIDVSGAQSCGVISDRHGNDLSLRGSFTRTDGRRGLVVDVLFQLN